VVLGLELRTFTLSHSTSPIFVKGYFKIESHERFAQGSFKLRSSRVAWAIGTQLYFFDRVLVLCLCWPAAWSSYSCFPCSWDDRCMPPHQAIYYSRWCLENLPGLPLNLDPQSPK
jgi:hypothetical protein